MIVFLVMILLLIIRTLPVTLKCAVINVQGLPVSFIAKVEMTHVLILPYYGSVLWFDSTLEIIEILHCEIHLVYKPSIIKKLICYDSHSWCITVFVLVNH